MMTPVPAVMVRTMIRIVVRLVSGMMLLHESPKSVWGLRAAVTSVEDCRTAKPMVRYRVYWVSFAVPDWPSCFRVSNRGMTTTSSWMMMLAVMYGMMPSANTDS